MPVSVLDPVREVGELSSLDGGNRTISLEATRRVN